LGRTLTLVASPTRVRLLDGITEIASHPRAYDRHELVAEPAHHQSLREQKRKALGSTAGGRLAILVPESPAFLQSAFERGESTARLTVQLLRLLDDYGPAELNATLREALDRHTPRLSSVAFILARRHRRAAGSPHSSCRRHPDRRHFLPRPGKRTGSRRAQEKLRKAPPCPAILKPIAKP